MSSPSKSQSQTPTLSSLLLRPSVSSTGQNYGNGGNGAGPEPTQAIYNNMPTTADAYWTERYPNMVKGTTIPNNFHPFSTDSATSLKHAPAGYGGPGGSFAPQRQSYNTSASTQGGTVPNYNLQQPYGPQGNYMGQQSLPVRTSSYGADQESVPNGATSSPKINVNSVSTGSADNQQQQQQQQQQFQPGLNAGGSSSVKHPTVAALKQEYPGSSPARSASPSSNCTAGAPNSPALPMRHSPVSPTPVSVYQTGCYPNQAHSAANPAFANFQAYGGGPAHSFLNDGYSNSLTSSNYQPAFGGYQGGGVYSNGPNAPSPSGYGPPSAGQIPSRFRCPPGPMGAAAANGPYAPTPDAYRPMGGHTFYNSPGRPPMNIRPVLTNGPTSFNERLDSPAVSDVDTRDSAHSNGTPVGDRPRTSTPATPSVGRTKMNGSKESHPSTPAPASPGGASSIPDDLDSSLSSPSWPRTPMSPAGTGRYMPQPPMGPPAPVNHPSISSSPSVPSSSGAPPTSAPPHPPPAVATHKESGMSLVQRLLGEFHQNQCSMQEWEDRRRFYERLVNFCETKGHPLTGQPTVSKQTVDLYRLYMSVKQNGGFEQVTKRKSWRELCTVFSIGQSNSASGQLKKQYAKILLPFECFYDLGDIDPGPILTACESKKKGKSKAAAAAAAAAQTYSDSLMGPPNSNYGHAVDSQGMPQPQPPPPQPNQNVPPYLQSGPYPPTLAAPNRSSVGQNQNQQQQQQAANETVVNPFDDRTPPIGSQQPQPPPHMYPPPTAANAAGHPQRPQYANFPPQNSQPSTNFPSDRTNYDAYSMIPPNVAYPPQSAQQQIGGDRTSQPQPPQPSANNRPTSANTNYIQPPPPPNSYPPASAGFETNQASSSNSQSSNVVLPPNQYLIPTANDSRRNNANQLSSASSSSNEAFQSAPSSSSATQQSNFHSQDTYPVVVGQNAGPSSNYYQQRSMGNHQNVDQTPNGPQKHSYIQSASGIDSAGHHPNYANTKSWIQQSAKYGLPLSAQQQPVLNTPNLPGHIAKEIRFYNTNQFSQRYSAAPYLQTGEVSIKAVPSSSSYGPPLVPRKEISPTSSFPPQSVEASIPFVKRRKKLYCRDLGRIDAWRIAMALKSGLAFETNWALNVLNVLLYDDNSVMYFGLSNLPSLLDTLVDLFRRTLSEILSDCCEFDGGIDEEVAYETVVSTDETSVEYVLKSTTVDEVSSSSDDNNCGGGATKKSKARTFFTTDNNNLNLNFTMTTRKGKRVKFVAPPNNLNNNQDTSTNYDIRPLQEYEDEFWQLGGSNSTEHMSTKFDETNDDVLKHKFIRCISSNNNTGRKRKFLRSTTDEDFTTTTNGVGKKRAKLLLEENLIETTKDNSNSNSSFFYTNKRCKNEQDEVFTHNKPPVNVQLQFKTSAVERCVCISNVLRGLSFVAGNEIIMAKNAPLIRTLASLLLLGHRHVERRRTPCKPSTVEDIDAMSECSSTAMVDDELLLLTNVNNKESSPTTDAENNNDDSLWFYDDALILVDDAFVILCNLSSSLDLFNHQENVARPIIESLLHWAVCRSPVSQDPLLHWSSVTPERYALEILCKLSVIERNVDLILATPPWDRLETLIEQLVTYLCVSEETALREFAVVLIHTFCCACPVAAVVAALQTSAVQYLVSFLEIADAEMHRVVQYHGMQTLRDNPEVIGTSVGMLRRAAGALLAMTKIPACHVRFYRHQLRLLNFTMSHLMDSRVGATIAEALYEIQKEMPKNALELTTVNGRGETTTTTSQTSATTDDREKNNVDIDTGKNDVEHLPSSVSNSNEEETKEETTTSD